MSTPARAVRKLAEPLAVKKKLAADAKAEAIRGRCICAGRPTRSIFPANFHWHRESNSVLPTKVARRRNGSTVIPSEVEGSRSETFKVTSTGSLDFARDDERFLPSSR